MSLSREQIIEVLHKKVVTVKFVKKDHSVREMHCTMMAEYIDAINWVKQTDRVRPPQLDQVSVIDVDKGEWRSFNISSLIEFDGQLV